MTSLTSSVPSSDATAAGAGSPALTSCSLLMPDRSSYRIEWIAHDGYTLTCEDIAKRECVRIADRAVELSLLAPAAAITSVTVSVDGGGTICTSSICVDFRAADLVQPSVSPLP